MTKTDKITHSQNASSPIKRLTVAAVQQKCSPVKSESLATSERQIRKAAEAGARLVVLQELHSTHYFCQFEDVSVFDLAETIPGPTSDRLATLAQELNIVIVASIFEKRATGLYHNTAVVLESDGSVAGTYRKMHIPDDPGFHEKFYFTPGDSKHSLPGGGFVPIDTSVGKLGVLVCWDQWYPEAARLMAMAGAEILIYPTAIGWDTNDTKAEQQRQLDAWITIQRSHAIANNLPLLSINRVGFEADTSNNTTGIDFWGNSFICGPQGEVLGHASNQSEETLIVDIDLGRSEEIRRIWPYLRDRRIDAYEDLSRRYID